MNYNTRRSKEKEKKSSLNPFLEILQNFIVISKEIFYIIYIIRKYNNIMVIHN